jgi:hypothetical protein
VIAMHLHNSDLLTFFETHANNPNIKEIIEEQNQCIQQLNANAGKDYKDYFDFLKRKSSDDAGITMAQLKGLLKPRFTIELSKDERKDFEYQRLSIAIDDLEKPVKIKDEGDFFTIWEKRWKGRHPFEISQRIRQVPGGQQYRV